MLWARGRGSEARPKRSRPRPPLRHGRDACDKIRPIRVIPEDDPALQPPQPEVVEGVRRIATGLTGHGRREPGARSVGPVPRW